MLSSCIRRAASSGGHTLRHILPADSIPPPSISKKPGNLYEIMSRRPDGGVGREVHQVRWGLKHIENCYWLVTRTRFKDEGRHGKAWGKLFWRGKQVTPEGKDERIPGGLKYSWQIGRSESIPGSKPIGVKFHPRVTGST